jgi:hypothetical protein
MTGGSLVAGNMFSGFGSISLLGKLMFAGWPCCALDEQLRICSGGSDLADATAYRDHAARYTAMNFLRASSRYKYAPRMDELLQGIDPSLSPSPEGRLWPVFVHCAGTACKQAYTFSRYNIKQAEKTIRFMSRVGKELSAAAGDMLVIVPYRAMQSCMRQRLDQLRGISPLADVRVATVDNCQGHEAPLTFFVMTVTAESGPGVVYDRHRLNVSMTRHSQMFFAIGDVDTVTSTDANLVINPPVDERQHRSMDYADRQHLFLFLDWFKRKGRVIRSF